MSTRWRAAPRAIHTRTPRGGVVLDPVSKAYFELNASGEVAWKVLERGASGDEIAAALCAEFEVEHAIARADAEALIGQLVGARLLVPAADDAGR